MQRGLSPEERLLRLIRKGPKKSPEPEGRREAAAPESGGRGRPPKASGAKGVLRRRPASPSVKGKGLRQDAIKVISRAFLYLLMVVVAYLLFDYIWPKPSRVEIELPAPEVVKEEPERKPPIEIKPYGFYAKEIGRRELFMPLVSKEGKPEEAGTLKELAANLSLIGIVASDGRLQAIIEDKKQRKTYFFYKGDSVGEIEIKDVLEGKVILGYGDEELALML